MSQKPSFDGKNVLKMPEGVAPSGPVADLPTAYFQAMIAIPVILAKLLEEIQAMSDALTMLSIYTMRKGKSENIFEYGDLEGEDGNEAGTGSGSPN